jgi:hypothetical protein
VSPRTGGGRLRRAALRVLLVAVLVAATGCRVDMVVRVALTAEGPGTVSVEVVLDEEAAREIGDLGGQLAVDDLEDVGWEVAGPTPVADGGVAVTASRGVAGPDELEVVLDELTGGEGPFADLEVAVEPGVTSTSYAVRGRVDLRSGVAAFGDEGLAERFDGAAAALDDEALEARAGAPVEQVVGVTLDVALPGAPTRGDTLVALPLGSVTPVDVASEIRHGDRLWWAGAALAAFLALGVVVFARWRTNPGPS